jgi:hypothetical protein
MAGLDPAIHAFLCFSAQDVDARIKICLQINQQTIAGKVAARKAILTGGLREADRLQRPE